MVNRKPQKRKASRRGDPNSTVKQRLFLDARRQVRTIREAAELAGCCRDSHRYWMDHDPTYPERYEDACEDFCDLVRRQIEKLAIDGEPVLYKGKATRFKRINMRALEMLAKSLMPHEFRERSSVEHSGEIGGETTLVITEDEGWYGNDAHEKARNQVAESAAASSAGPDIGGEIQAPGVRPAVGQDGGGPTSDDPGPRAT